MPRTKREKILAIVTISVALVALGYARLDDMGSVTALFSGGAEIEALREQYAEYARILERGEATLRAWSEVEQPYEVPPGMTPEAHFSEMALALCKQMQLQNVQIDPHEIRDIRDVEEYGLIYLPISFGGPWDRVVPLLKAFDASGYLIDDLVIRAPRDDPTVSVDLKIARPVKLSQIAAEPNRVDYLDGR